MTKWRLVVKTLPWVLIVLGVMFVRRYVPGINFKNWQVQFLVVGTMALIYLYLLQLIRDLDNPFEYAEGYAAGREFGD
jgi:hypothetical protein